ncbi:NTF2-like domain-containing protein [Brazilian cedratvirus IHUMI]|uniref:NTF2-like domain-containing protein n=1 Tax=Brazilian cedratvirus IHUMI TaxID=2126980 RepID=A0A2R8FF21_9VIRU|nr:NTF2-like domain-containing protein [Brazilian cedratvirus IHUMI]
MQYPPYPYNECACQPFQHVVYGGESRKLSKCEKKIRNLVLKHARAWGEHRKDLLIEVLSKDVLFAYPTQNLNYQQTLADFDVFVQTTQDNTQITIPRDGIVMDEKLGIVYLNWKFDSTTTSGTRAVVNDICKGIIRNGEFVQWLEFLDGRVRFGQAAGILSYSDGPDCVQKPWPVYNPGREGCRAVVSWVCPVGQTTQENKEEVLSARHS